MGGASRVAGGQLPLSLPGCTPVVRTTMLYALLALSTIVRQAEYSFKIFRLRHVLTLLSSIGPVVKSLLDIGLPVA